MGVREDAQNALNLIRQGRSDFDVERLSGIPLIEIIGLRGGLAAAKGGYNVPRELVQPSRETRLRRTSAFWRPA